MQSSSFKFDNSYARLPDRFFVSEGPRKVSAPTLIKFNYDLADDLGLDGKAFLEAGGLEILAGNNYPEDSSPLAMAYAGHQFGNFVPQLGDGRANLIGEVIDKNGIHRDIQLKGSGPTAFSRNGDGRSALGPVIREYIVSEAMHALGVPTTRSLAMVTTGDQVARETLLPGGVLTRVAASHLRIGTFQYFAARKDGDAIARLIDYALQRHYPELADSENKALALLSAVIENQANLIAKWMQIGFIHGVMNTDNMSISGETIDYGPCAFMDQYDPEQVYSYIDRQGRYAYANQPRIAQWNLARLAECLLEEIDENQERAVELAQIELEKFASIYMAAWLDVMRGKLGLGGQEEGDIALVTEFLQLLQVHNVDFTSSFRNLSGMILPDANEKAFLKPFGDGVDLKNWFAKWRARSQNSADTPEKQKSRMDAVNPLYIPRNHLIEQALQEAVETGKYGLVDQLCEVLANPFTEQDVDLRYTQPPRAEEQVQNTFCGT